MITVLVLLLFFIALAWHGRFEAFWLSFDQMLNVLIGSGYSDEALSAFAHRRGGWRRAVINGLFFWQDDHCAAAFYSELKRRHLPPEYRT